MTMVELVLAVGLLAALSGVALFGISKTIRSAELSWEGAKLVDGVVLARMNGISNQQLARVFFEPPAVASSSVAREFRVEFCSTQPSCSSWSQLEAFELRDGVGLLVPKTGGTFIDLSFNKDGYYQGPDRVIEVCRIKTDLAGVETCEAGTWPKIRIYANTGIVEY